MTHDAAGDAQEEHHRGDVVGRARAPERDRAGQLVELVLDAEHLAERLGDDGTRRHRVDPDATLGQLERERLGEVDQPGLGRRVRPGVRASHACRRPT